MSERRNRSYRNVTSPPATWGTAMAWAAPPPLLAVLLAAIVSGSFEPAAVADDAARSVETPAEPSTAPEIPAAAIPPENVATTGTPAVGLNSAPPPTPPERIPYRIQLELALDLGFDDSLAARIRLRDQIRGILGGQVGAFWDFTLADDGKGWLTNPREVDRKQPEDFARFMPEPMDKVFLVGVVRTGIETVVSAREWDAATNTLGLPVIRSTFDRRETSIIVVGAIQGAFRPLVHVDQAKDGAITLRGRAAQISPHDGSWNPLRENAVYEPYYRYLNKERRVERITRIPWTYLVSGEPVSEEGQAPGIPVSGLRTAISARRRRIEAVALGVAHSDTPTIVQLTTRAPAKRAVFGVEVQVRSERTVAPPAEGGPPSAPLATLITDRKGEIVIPSRLASPGTPVWLFVYSGSQMLGRVPFVPGVRPREELELADDSLRLQVEGDIALLQARLVDLAAQRAVAMALVRKRAEENDFAAADGLLKKVEEFVKPAALLSDLNTIRSPALKSAREQRDKSTEARIKKLCDDTAEIINVHFSDDKIAELKEELGELKDIAADKAAGAPPRPKKPRTKKSSTKVKKKPDAGPVTPPEFIPRDDS